MLLRRKGIPGVKGNEKTFVRRLEEKEEYKKRQTMVMDERNGSLDELKKSCQEEGRVMKNTFIL